MFMHNAEYLLGKDLALQDICYNPHWNPPGFLPCRPRAGGVSVLLFIQYHARPFSPL
jgi:hypothetical protein